MRRIACIADVEADLDALVAADARLAPVRARAGQVPLRLAAPGFASLVGIVVGQQVSRASADAILARLTALAEPLSPGVIAAAPDELFRQSGLSRPKQKTLRAIAAAILDGSFSFEGLGELDADAAIRRMMALHGVGPWTAECYLLFAAGHPDVFPAGDVALQTAAGHALGLSPRPDARRLRTLSESWRPWRGAAARLLWAYYRAIGGREAAPPAMEAQDVEN